MKNTNLKYWHDFTMEVSLSFNNITLENYLNNFWDKVMKSLSSNQKVYVFLKVKFDDGSYASLSKMQTINNTMFNELLSTLLAYLDLKAENYSNKLVTHVIFQYHILTVLNSKKLKTKLVKSDKIKKVPSFSFSGYNLPLTTDVNLFGDILSKSKNKYIIAKKGSNLVYNIDILVDKQIVKLSNKGKVLLEFTDIFGINPTSFVRILKDQEFRYINGQLVLKKLVRKTKYISKIKLDKTINNKFITLDIETRTIDNIMEPYCISIYDGSKFNTFYLSDFKNSKEMLINAISALMKRSYNGYKVYIHNLSHFDGIFLLRILSSIPNTNLTPIMKEGKMISLKFSWNTNSTKTYSIDFKDSLLMLPNSLSKLAKAFINVGSAGVENKGIFPYAFVTNNLNYVGEVPNIRFFDIKFSIEDYYNYKAKFNDDWNLRKFLWILFS